MENQLTDNIKPYIFVKPFQSKFRLRGNRPLKTLTSAINFNVASTTKINVRGTPVSNHVADQLVYRTCC